jgi:hypothetical protein
MRMILAAAVLAALAFQANAKDDPHGPQWHFMDHGADMHFGYPPLVRAPHPAMGDVCTQGH